MNKPHAWQLTRLAWSATPVLLLTLSSAMAGPYTDQKNRVCPAGWSQNDRAIPIVYATSDPWEKAKEGQTSADKTNARAHLSSNRPVITIDKATPVTTDDLMNDPLTVASECLVYRNFEVDTFDYQPPPMPKPNVATGWIPAIF